MLANKNLCYKITHAIILAVIFAFAMGIMTELILYQFSTDSVGPDGIITGYDKNHSVRYDNTYGGISDFFNVYCEIIENKNVDIVEIKQINTYQCEHHHVKPRAIFFNICIGVILLLFCIRCGLHLKYHSCGEYEMPSIILGIISVILFCICFNMYMGYFFKTLGIYNVGLGHINGYRSINYTKTVVDNCGFSGDISFMNCYCHTLGNYTGPVDYIKVGQFGQCTTYLNPYLIGFIIFALMFIVSYVLVAIEYVREYRSHNEINELIINY